MTIEIIKYTPKHKKNLIGFLKYMWKDLDEDERKQRFEWQYLQNPYQKKPCIYLALDNDRVVGFRGAVLQIFELNATPYTIFSFADSIVDPDYRRKGIFAKLIRAVINDLHKNDNAEKRIIVLNLTSNQLSTAVNLKYHWHKASRLKRFHYKFSTLNIIKKKVVKKADQKKLLPKITQQSGGSLEISRVMKAEDLAGFWSKNRNPRVWTNVRDKTFYEWRYGYQPEKYIFIYNRRHDVLDGYLVVQQSSDFQWVLQEYGSTSAAVFRQMIKGVMKTLEIPILRTWAIGASDRELMAKSGFVYEPGNYIMRFIGKKRLPILVRPTESEPIEKDFFFQNRDIRDIENWQIFIADSH